MVEFRYPDGGDFRLSCEFLRVFSPSAEVRGHGMKRPPPVDGKRDVNVRSAEPVGNYGVRFMFDDGHDTGIYSWRYLEELIADRDRYWEEYLVELKAHNLSRLPGIPMIMLPVRRRP